MNLHVASNIFVVNFVQEKVLICYKKRLYQNQKGAQIIVINLKKCGRNFI